MKKRVRTVQEMGEFPLIDCLTKKMSQGKGVVCGVGDDCAVLKRDTVWYDLLKTDMVIEHVHFTRASVTPEQIGHKALGRVISDIAAMGGIPSYAVIALAVPPATPVSYVERIYTGMRHLADRFDVSIVGGDTSSSSCIMITVSMLGKVEKKCVMYRSGAQPGDVICVTGTLGGSLRKKHATFIPRVHEARWLAMSHYATAMIDISDGFLQDLGHIMKRSKVGAVIEWRAVPVSRDALVMAQGNKEKALSHAMTDGEDFELLCTLSEDNFVRASAKWKKLSGVPLTCVGRVIRTQGIYDTEGSSLMMAGYTHFRKKRK